MCAVDGQFIRYCWERPEEEEEDDEGLYQDRALERGRPPPCMTTTIFDNILLPN